MSLSLKENFGEQFLKQDFKTIYASTSDAFQEIVTYEQFTELGLSFNQGVTKYTCISENTFLGLYQYIWLDQEETKAIQVAFDSENTIQGLYLKPYVTYPKSNKQWTKNTYSFPIQDEWYVFWGGNNEFVNYHYPYEQQRYAYDLVKQNNNCTYKDIALKNESYFAYDSPIAAPADGIVIQLVDGIEDNIPGEMKEAQPAGNYCILAHANKEFSMIAHMKKNSFKVKEGERVEAGQILGLCGNSGNSSEAHIHFQVMDQADWTKANSLRIRFHDGLEPIQGEAARPSTPNKQKRDMFDKLEDTFTVGELMLAIPKAIGHFFK